MDIDIDTRALKLNIQPQVMAGLLSLNDNSDTNFKKLDRLIKSDQNMATLVLKAANSSLYIRGKEVATLQHAISILGLPIVRALAMSAASKVLFESGNYSRFKRLIWEHSFVTGILANHLAAYRKKKELKEEAFVAGLLHDIGKVLLNIVDRKKFIAVITIVEEEKISFAEAETRIFGFNHMELGAKAAVDWNLPEVYHPIISQHMYAGRDLNGSQKEISAESRELLDIVSYANYIAKKNGFGAFNDEDEKDAIAMEAAMNISEKEKNYFTNGYSSKIQQDEFYKFFMTIL